MRQRKIKKRVIAWLVLVMLLSQNIFSVMADAQTDKTAKEATSQVVQETQVPEETGEETEGTKETTSENDETKKATPAAKATNQIAPFAEPLTGGLLTDYLTGFKFTDINEETFSDTNKVTTTSAADITYSFEFKNDLDIQKDAEFTLDLPNIFDLASSLSTPTLITNDAGINVRWWVDANAKVHLKFYEAVPASNVKGTILISTKVDKTKISGENVEFDLGNYNGNNSFPIEYPDGNLKDVIVEKVVLKDTFDPEKQLVEWCITVTPGKLTSLAGLTVHDTTVVQNISKSGELEIRDVYLDSKTNKIAVDPVTDGFTYTFPDDITPGAHKLYVVTYITPEAYDSSTPDIPDDTEYQVAVGNSAEVWRGNTKLEEASSSARFDQELETISKICTKEDWENNTFIYEVTINQEHLKRQNVKFIEHFPKGFGITAYTGVEEGVPGDIFDRAKNIQYDADNNQIFSFELDEINHPVTFTFHMRRREKSDGTVGWADLEPIMEDGKIVSYRVTNTAEVYYDEEIHGRDTVEFVKDVNELDTALDVTKTGEITDYVNASQAKSKWTSVLTNVDGNKSIPIIFKDIIESKQTYVPGSFKVNNKSVEDKIVWKEEEKQLTYTLSQEDCQLHECIITYETYLSITDKEGEEFNNRVVVDYGDFLATDDASVTPHAVDMLSKSGVFNPRTQEFEWSVVINSRAELSIVNLMVKDSLPDNHEYIEGSVKAYDVSNTTTERSTPIVTKDSEGNPTVAVGDCEGEVQLDFRTKMKEGFDPATAYNEVSIWADNIGGLDAATTVEVSFDPRLEKNTDYVDGAAIDWEVDINTAPYRVDAEETLIQAGTYLEDVLHPSLEVDLKSVKLYQVTRDNKYDTYRPVTPVTAILGGDASYEESNRTFTYKLPEDIDLSKSYRLVFTTNVVNAGFKNLNNSITMKSSSYDKTADSDAITLSNLGGLATLEGDNLQIDLLKTGEGDQPLKDVGFEFYEMTQSGGKNIIQKFTTPSDGMIRFTKNIKFLHTYYIRETTVADGYQDATDDIYTVEIGDGSTATSEKVAVKITKNLGEGDVQSIFDGEVAIAGNKQFVIPVTIKNKKIGIEDVKIRKTDITGSDEVDGATLTIYEKNADGSKGAVIDTWVSGETGEIAHEVDKALLDFGKSYILEETQAPDGYDIAKDIEFSIQEDGKLVVADKDLDENGNIIMKDELLPTITTVDLLLSKEVTGTAGDKTKDFTFTITLKDLNDIELTDSFAYLKNQVNGGILKSGDSVTLRDGDVVVIKDIPAGTAYTIVESDNAGYEVTPDGDTGVTIAGSNSAATFKNHKDQESHEPIVIRKTDITGSREVAGATLTIYHKNSDGSKGTVIDSWVSGDEGYKIAWDTFTAGESYILEETIAPDGYAYTADIEFTIGSDGTIQAAVEDLDTDGNIIMKDEVIGVTFKKTDVAGKELIGATLVIYERNADGSQGSEITRWVSGENSESVHVVVGKLIAGKEYILHEADAPEGYEYAADIIFKVENDGSITADSKYLDEEGNIIMIDELTPIITTVDLYLNKTVTGTAGDKTKDFTFIVTLKDLNGQELSDSFAYLKNQANGGTLKSGDSIKLKHDDVVVIKGLPVGTSYEVEERDNDGYEVNAQGNKSITVAGTAGQVTFINHKDEDVDFDDIKIRKTDITGSQEVAGATLTIYEKNSDGSRGKEITQWISGQDGEKVHVVEGMLNAGQTYILHETSAPEGYAYADDIEFTLTANGTLQVAAEDLDGDGNIVMKDEAEGSVQISKVEIGGDGTIIPLEGATLSIYTTDAQGKKTGTIAKDTNGKELRWTTTNHPVNITNLKYGTYVLHEEKAPEGYLVAADIYFTINQDGSIVKISKTGILDGKTLIMEDIREGDVDPGAFGLSISKTVTGTEGDKYKPFTFTVTLTDENGEELDDVFIYTYGDIADGLMGTFQSGDSFYLTHGEHVQFFGIPVGTNYEVIESDNEGYEVIEDNTSGTIGDAGDAQEASFINHKGEDETPTPTKTPTETPTVTPTPTATEAPTATPTPTGKGDNNYIRKVVRAQTYRSVKTEDSTQLMLWVVGMIGAAGVISIVLYKKKRKEQTEQ